MTDLIRQIDALLDLDARGALVPHGIGGLARELLTESRAALASLTPPSGGVKQPISLSDPLTILAGIEQFGLASDGSDLRDLRAALEAVSPAPGEPVAFKVAISDETKAQLDEIDKAARAAARQFSSIIVGAPTSPGEPPQGWKDISTAPKDGTRVLLWHESNNVKAGGWPTFGSWREYSPGEWSWRDDGGGKIDARAWMPQVALSPSPGSAE